MLNLNDYEKKSWRPSFNDYVKEGELASLELDIWVNLLFEWSFLKNELLLVQNTLKINDVISFITAKKLNGNDRYQNQQEIKKMEISRKNKISSYWKIYKKVYFNKFVSLFSAI